jgi:hypothetical protein
MVTRRRLYLVLSVLLVVVMVAAALPGAGRLTRVEAQVGTLPTAVEGKNVPGAGDPIQDGVLAAQEAPLAGSKNGGAPSPAGDGDGVVDTTVPKGPKSAPDDATPVSLGSDVAAGAVALGTLGELLTCGASGNMDWTTTSSTRLIVRQCTLTVPQDGYLFISASASLARQDGEYEAEFRVGIDSTTGDISTDRWVNVYNDAGDGTDESMALSVLKPVEAGAHTIYLLGKRYSGAGTVLVYDPTLSVIYIPAAGVDVLACGAQPTDWTTTSSALEVAAGCSLTVPGPGVVFLSAGASMGRATGPFEAQFEIGIDSTAGDGNIDRWVNVYDDTGDGTDKSMALSVLKNVGAGAHTFYLLGKRYSGAGAVLAYRATLTAIYIPATSTRAVACGASGDINWTTTSGSFQVMRQCTVNVPQAGYAFIAGDSSLARYDGEYEAQFEIGVDSTAGDNNIDRWVNIYNDTGDGTDKSMAISVLKPVARGMHTFYLLGRRYGGAGAVLAYDPTLTVIIPGANWDLFLPLVTR